MLRKKHNMPALASVARTRKRGGTQPRATGIPAPIPTPATAPMGAIPAPMAAFFRFISPHVTF